MYAYGCVCIWVCMYMGEYAYGVGCMHTRVVHAYGGCVNTFGGCVYAYGCVCMHIGVCAYGCCVYAYVSCVIWWEEEEYENNDVKTAYDAFPLHALPGCLWVHCGVHHHEIKLSVSFNCSSPPPFHYFG